MDNKVDAQELIYQDIVCYYLPEELPPDKGAFKAVLPELAKESAKRLRKQAKNETGDLITILQTARRDPAHPLIQEIDESSLLGWTEEPNWSFLQELFDLIVTELKVEDPLVEHS